MMQTQGTMDKRYFLTDPARVAFMGVEIAQEFDDAWWKDAGNLKVDPHLIQLADAWHASIAVHA